MWWIADSTDNAVPLLTRQLSVPSQRHNVTNALLVNHTDAAAAVLLQHIRKEYDWQVAAILLNDERVRDGAMPLVKKSLLTGHSIKSETELHHLLRRVRDAATLTAIFSDVDVQEAIRQQATCQEGSFWFVGTKATAIEALAMVDPQAAYAAALAALQNASFHDREMYPYLMTQIDANRSIRDLIEQSQAERHTSVLWAIARALSKTDCLEAIKTLIVSVSSKQREVGCKLCIHGEFRRDVERKPSAPVERPNKRCCPCRPRGTRGNRISTKHESASSGYFRRKRITAIAGPCLMPLLLLLIQVMKDNLGPEWASRIVDTLPFAMRRYLGEGVDKRRKDVREEAHKQDR